MYEMLPAGLSDTGRVRKNNEDSFLVDKPLLIVADGMGGAAAGEIASSLTVEVISSSLKNASFSSDEEITGLMENAILKADSEIKERTKKSPELKGMGTTVVAALHIEDRLLIGNVGDSRAYIVTCKTAQPGSPAHESESIDTSAETAVMQAITDDFKPSDQKEESIRRITEDHSVVMDMVRSKVITEADIRTHPLKNRITRCVGNFTGAGPEFIWHDIQEDETLIICSDGLWEMVYEDLILAIVKSSSTLEETCQRLIDAANKKGGADNITVVAATFRKK